jgi:hypothetical protein
LNDLAVNNSIFRANDVTIDESMISTLLRGAQQLNSVAHADTVVALMQDSKMKPSLVTLCASCAYFDTSSDHRAQESTVGSVCARGCA